MSDDARKEVQEETDRRRGAVLSEGRVRWDLTISGGTKRRLTFRVPDLEDLAIVDEALPLLSADEKIEEEAEQDPEAALEQILLDPKRTQRFMKRANKLLCVVCLDPLLTPEFRYDEEGVLPVRSIGSNDRMFIFLTLVGFAGFDALGTAEIVPFVEAADSSSKQIDSPNGTEDDPTSTS